MTATVEHSADEHRWLFSDHRVTQLHVAVDNVRIESWTLDASVEITLGAPFALLHADGTSRDIDPEESEELAPLLTIVGRPIERLTVTRSGTLDVAFGDGTSLTSSASKSRQAFAVRGSGALEGLEYIVAPGGGAPW